MFGFFKSRSGSWPVRVIGRRQKKELYVEFDNGKSGVIDAELLRVFSPSAEVKGHGSRIGKPVLNKENITINELVPVGNYAVRIIFDDGHSTGLYTWDLLFDLLCNKTKRRKEYLARKSAE